MMNIKINFIQINKIFNQIVCSSELRLNKLVYWVNAKFHKIKENFIHQKLQLMNVT